MKGTKSKAAHPTNLEVLQTLWGLSHAVESRSKRMLREIGITGPQRLVLRTVGVNPGCSAGEVARILHLDPGTVSRLVAGLKRAKLVRDDPDPVDGRRARLMPTARGTRLGAEQRGTVEAAVRAALRASSREEGLAARRFLERLTSTLDTR